MRVLLAGGGTGGHIYPALAIFKEIKSQCPESSFAYIGTAQGLEATIVQKENIPFYTIDITGFKRKLTLDNVQTVYRFLKGVQDSKKIIHQFKPDIVIGTGGYVCGPSVYAAAKLHIPTLIHEQNVIPGLTNKFLSRYASVVAVSFPGSERYFRHQQVRVTGNPRATEVSKANGEKGRSSLGIPQDKKVVLIVGGSRGAKAINQAFLEMLDQLGQLKECHFIYVTGDVHYEQIQEKLTQKSLEQVTVRPFLYNMPDVLAGTDLIVNRAGASFLAEITALGLPSILIPSPYVTNNHQEKNARWMEAKGAAKVIVEKELDGSLLFATIKELMEDTQLLAEMGASCKRLGNPDAAIHIHELIKELIK